MEITGTLHKIFEPVTGQGKNGPWKKQEFLLELPGQYPRQVLIAVWGDRINLASFTPGSQITASIDLESREFNGRYYTDVKAWKIVAAGSNTMAKPDPEAPVPPPPSFEGVDSLPQDDLPF